MFDWKVTGNIYRGRFEREEQVLGLMIVISVQEKEYQEKAWSVLGYFVSGRKLNFNFIGIKILETKETSYDNSLCKHSGHKILRYREDGGKKETSNDITSWSNQFTSGALFFNCFKATILADNKYLTWQQQGQSKMIAKCNIIWKSVFPAKIKSLEPHWLLLWYFSHLIIFFS